MKLVPTPGFSHWSLQLGIGLAVVACTQAAGAIFLGYLGGLGYLLTGVTTLICIGLATAVMERHEVPMLVLGLGCMGTAFATGLATKQYLHDSQGARVTDLRVEELHNRPDAIHAEFADAKVFVPFHAFHTYTTKHRQSGTTQTLYMIAPLASSTWTRDQPVPAWVVSGGTLPPPAEWSADIRHGTLVHADGDGSSRLDGAIAKALAKHGLKGSTSAPMLRWGKRPEDLTRENVRNAILMIGIMGFPWMFCIIADILRSLLSVFRRASSPSV